MKKKKLETKLLKTKKKLVKAESKVAELESRLEKRNKPAAAASVSKARSKQSAPKDGTPNRATTKRTATAKRAAPPKQAATAKRATAGVARKASDTDGNKP